MFIHSFICSKFQHLALTDAVRRWRLCWTAG